MGYEKMLPPQGEHERAMKMLADVIERSLDKDTGFSLFVYDFKEEGDVQVNCISNTEYNSMLDVVQNFIAENRKDT